MLYYLHTYSRTNTFTRTMKITRQSWASIKNVCVVLLLERTHTIKHGRTTTIYFWYILHSSNKNYKFPSSFSLLLFIPHFFSPWPNSFIFTPNAYNCSPIHSNFYYLWSILLILSYSTFLYAHKMGVRTIMVWNDCIRLHYIFFHIFNLVVQYLDKVILCLTLNS